MNLVFYDFETTGTSTDFDQILQVGAVLTDENFNELERHEGRCRLLPHVAPSPGALLVTGITIDRLVDPALPSHYDMICRLREKLEQWSPALFVGYNSMNFDERMLRQAFYQCLHPIFLTNTRGNTRNDVLTLVRATAALAPDVIAIPVDDEGARSLKLDRLAPANGFHHARAHDALGDVEATIHVCHLIRERAPGVWRRFIEFSQRTAVENFLRRNEWFFAIDGGNDGGHFGMQLGSLPDNDRIVLYFDLRIDPQSLSELTDGDLAKRMPPKAPQIVRRIRTNAGPFLVTAAETPIGLQTSAEETSARASRLSNDAALRDRLLGAYLASRQERAPSPHIERQIYDGFWSRSDEGRMASFHDVPTDQRWALVGEFEDERARKLARRLIYLEASGVMPPEEREDFDVAVAKRMLGCSEHPGDWLTFPKALEQTNERLSEATAVEVANILGGLHAWLGDRIGWAEAVLERASPLLRAQADLPGAIHGAPVERTTTCE